MRYLEMRTPIIRKMRSTVISKTNAVIGEVDTTSVMKGMNEIKRIVSVVNGAAEEAIFLAAIN